MRIAIIAAVVALVIGVGAGYLMWASVRARPPKRDSGRPTSWKRRKRVRPTSSGSCNKSWPPSATVDSVWSK